MGAELGASRAGCRHEPVGGGLRRCRRGSPRGCRSLLHACEDYPDAALVRLLTAERVGETPGLRDAVDFYESVGATALSRGGWEERPDGQGRTQCCSRSPSP